MPSVKFKYSKLAHRNIHIQNMKYLHLGFFFNLKTHRIFVLGSILNDICTVLGYKIFASDHMKITSWQSNKTIMWHN